MICTGVEKMQINSQHIYQKSVVPEDPLELKQEEVYRASVKEKLNGSEAILQIRGKDNETLMKTEETTLESN